MIKHIGKILLSGAIIAASAQAAQKLTIDFPFRTPVGELPAGTYNVDFTQLGTGKYIQLRNAGTGAAVLFHPNNPVTNIRGTEQPRAIFSCAQSGCTLRRIWTSGVDGFDFRQKKLTPAQAERLAVIPIQASVAE